MTSKIIRLSSLCNQKCLFCNQEEEISIKSKKEVLQKLLNYRSNKVDKLIISGGEPTLHKDLLFFTLSLAKKLGFSNIELQTNAVLLHDIEYVKYLKVAGLDSAMISLHSFESNLSDYLTQANLTFDLTVKGIKNLLIEKIKVTINIVINKLNYKL